ncbi:OmpA family protein [Arenimonas composti]|uniref:OmpA-like domain-containing protein n=1 Tax=Arenimonas composti TR7-09 = DSM 18010 TaxID=1121013 RepID=A0A091BHC4_9GAMM|nr:OmpA family protein [Arenimonas composti]KFN51156.1 hypothetical protein P873_04460 [Arenimonas composti TR7-09 = DSM 18010]
MKTAFRFAAVTLALAAGTAAADCAPLGTLPGYEPDSETKYAWHRNTFRVADADGSVREQPVAGRYCEATYIFQGDTPMSALEIQYNYREQLAALGATVAFAEGNDTHAWFDRDGTRHWVHVYSDDHRIDIVVVDVAPHRPTLTAPCADDHRLFGHMPGFVAEEPERRNFDEAEFRSFDADGGFTGITAQGAKYHARFVLADGGQPVGWPDVIENFRHAVLARGGEIVHDGEENNLTARLMHEGQLVWVGVYSEDRMYELTVIEEKPFASSLLPPEPDALRAALDAEGRVALYVNFDFGKATLRPDAAPVLDRVQALMQADPALALSIEGHTDDIGGDAANLALSRARAAAVVAALVGRGIDAGRLASDGHGEGRPLVANTDSASRAKNRRVELVKR